MKIGLLTTSYPRHAEDYRGIFIKRLADSLEEAGVSVEIIEPRGYEVLKGGSGLVPNLKKSLLAKLVFPVYCLHFLVLATVRARGCDLLHANWSLSGWFAVVAARLSGKSVLLTERSPLLIGSENRWVNRFLRWVMTRCDVIVTISETAGEMLRQKFSDLEFTVIPNGVQHDVFKPRQAHGIEEECNGATTVLTVGRVTAVKRLDVFLDAISNLRESGLPVRASIIGGGDQLAALRRSVNDNDVLRDCVEFAGSRTPDHVAKAMADAGVFVLCSEMETGGNVVLEAMSSGLAVISTPVGWANDFITDGENGFVTPIGDVAALTVRLEGLAKDSAARARLGRAARRTILERKLTWEGCAERYIACYRTMLAGERT